MKSFTAIGLMSGTSMDGIDVALITTDGAELLTRGPAMSLTYQPAFRARLVGALDDATLITKANRRPGKLAAVEAELTDLHIKAVLAFLKKIGKSANQIDVIGFHGQTVLHRPDQRLTVQLGDGPRMAQELGVSVVHDFRQKDIAASGQGAPLAPVYHRALVVDLPQRPIVMVNIGGVANVTHIDAEGELLAFDTGPGNALIDDWVTRHSGQAMDRDGALAAAGTCDSAALSAMLKDPYFELVPPKSLDRNHFSLAAIRHLDVFDGARTLTAFTAATLAGCARFFAAPAKLWVICGGGRLNPVLMSELKQLLGDVVAAETVGIDGDALEAEAFAYLAVRSLNRLPITFPGTTGVDQPLIGGAVARSL